VTALGARAIDAKPSAAAGRDGRSAGDVRLVRSGRWVRLDPLHAGHLDFLYSLCADERIGPRWRYGGTIPTAEQFRQNLWNGVLCQFVVVERATDALVGHVQAYNADLNSGVGYLALALCDQAASTGLGIEAGYLFCAYAFSVYALRKLYLEIPEFNLGQVASLAGSIAREEGCLRDHVYLGGRYWDRHILSLRREDFVGRSFGDLREQWRAASVAAPPST